MKTEQESGGKAGCFLLRGPKRAQGILKLQASKITLTDFRMCKDRIWKSEAESCNSLQLLSKQKSTDANWSKLFRKIKKSRFG